MGGGGGRHKTTLNLSPKELISFQQTMNNLNPKGALKTRGGCDEKQWEIYSQIQSRCKLIVGTLLSRKEQGNETTKGRHLIVGNQKKHISKTLTSVP